MRFLRVCTVMVFIASVLFSVMTNYRYYRNLNTDAPVLINTYPVLSISVNDPPEELMRGLSAMDETDGDLTDEIIVASMSHFLEPGTVNVKYVVFDSHNNFATLTRRVHYTDYESPVFSLDKSPVYTVGNSFDLLNYVKVEDCIDGDITDQIRVISNMVNNYYPGTYPVVLEVSNSCGETTQITLWATFLNKKPSASVKLHRYVLYVEQGSTFEPDRWLASVTDDDANALNPAFVQFQGNLDVNTPGCYPMVYNYDDGTHTGMAVLTVVVTERQA